MSNLDRYQKAWESDAPISNDELDAEARRVPTLHARWWRFYTDERLRFKELDLQLKVLTKEKWEWYSGKMLDEDRLKRGWEPNPRKVLSTNIPQYLDADADMQMLQREKSRVEETLRFLEDVIKSINNRGYLLKTSVDFLRFKMGV